MNLLEKYNCIFCKYRKLNKNHDYACVDSWDKDECGYAIRKCNSLLNIYYRKIIKLFPFKQLDYWRTEIAYKKEVKYKATMDKKYGNYCIETDDLKFIWGVASWDDLSGRAANMYTMNDINITYDKQKKEYMLGIETSYVFENFENERDYLVNCLNAFTRYMDDNGLNKHEPYRLFMSNPCTSMVADSIEELYTNFKIFVDGYCNQNTTKKMKRMENNYVQSL